MKSDEHPEYYESVIAEHIAEFVRFKRAQGLKYGIETFVLRDFSRFVAQAGHTAMAIDQALVDRWCAARPNRKRITQRTYAGVLRQFLIYLGKQGLPTAMPRVGRTGSASSYQPHIFTADEISRFFAACDQNARTCHSPEQAAIGPVLFRLLYSTGMRLGEALGLTIANVNLVDGIATVLEGKFDKDRLVPLSESMASLLCGYLARRSLGAAPDRLLFARRNGDAVAGRTAYGWFRMALESASIPHGGKGKGPRLHDLRHTFAVHSLKAMVDRGMDIYTALPILSTHLGHASVKATGQYVRLTQDMLPETINTIAAATAHIIPGCEQP